MKISKMKQAASLISSFNLKDCVRFSISVFFAEKNGRPLGVSFNSFGEDEAREYSKKQWLISLEEASAAYSNCELVTVATVRISFWLKLDSCVYTIEATGRNGELRFDRLLFMRGGICEAFLTRRESAKVRGVNDVVKLTRKMPPCRTNIVKSDSSLCICEWRAKLFDNDLLYEDLETEEDEWF